ncbi:MAG: acyl-CoA dehydrogenase, partial [Sphingomonas sp.]
MPQYTPPIRDTRFVLEHVVGLDAHAQVDGFANATPDTVDAVLEEGGRFVAEVLFPLNQVGDEHGCTRHEDGSVTTAPGFREAYGGQAMPHVVSTAFQEYMISANRAFAMYPGLAHGA